VRQLRGQQQLVEPVGPAAVALGVDHVLELLRLLLHRHLGGLVEAEHRLLRHLEYVLLRPRQGAQEGTSAE
jgi:hypothetical protein